MGLKYKGTGHVNGVVAGDIDNARLQSLPSDLRQIVLTSPHWQHCEDTKLLPPITATGRYALDSVLVVTPTYRLEPETVKALFEIDWHKRIDYFLTKDNPYPHSEFRGYANIAHNMTKARDVFLSGSWDAMLIVESDIVVPRDVMHKLARVDADVAGGLYVMRFAASQTNFMIYAPDNPEQLIACLAAQVRYQPRLSRSNGVSCGCTLIRRHVLEQIAFRFVPPQPPDWWFMQDCNKAGFVTAIDTTLACGHIQEDGVMLMPEVLE